MRVEVNTRLLDGLTAKTKQNIATVLNRASMKHVSRARQLAPVDTGALRASIDQLTRATPGSLIAVNAVGVEYGIHQEFGTRYQSGTPYFLPSFISVANETKAELAKVI